jgi:Fe-S-cluster containining protein
VTTRVIVGGVYDCDNCGVCCERLIVDDVGALDVLREPAIVAQGVLLDGNGALPVDALRWRLSPRKAGTRIVGCPFHVGGRCAIYATRPNACVSFQAGCSQCQELRQRHGLQALKPRKAVTLLERVRQFATEDEE